MKSPVKRLMRPLVTVIFLAGFSLGISGCGSLIRGVVKSAIEQQDRSSDSTPREIGSSSRRATSTAIEAPVPPSQSEFTGDFEAVGRLLQLSQAQLAFHQKSTPSRFTSNLNDLGSNFLLETASYFYQIDSVGLDYVIMTARAKNTVLRSYTSVVTASVVMRPSGSTRSYSRYVICQTEQPSTMPIAIAGAISASSKFECPVGSKAVYSR